MSFGTMVSLLVIWCVSLCASRISRKDMPALALRLAAEEVTAVLHSNAHSQPSPAQLRRLLLQAIEGGNVSMGL